MFIDIVIGVLAALIVAFTVVKQFFLYRNNHQFDQFCCGRCTSCSKNCRKYKV